MKLVRFEIDQRVCRRCGSCQRVCPRSAVIEGDDGELLIDQGLCDRCGLCREACKLRAVARRTGLFF